jgi:hypothetical protein
VSAPRPSPNSDILIRVARRIAPLLNQLVFVGGQVAELLVTDPLSTRVRPTDDVDVITAAATRSRYHTLGQQLKRLGFREDDRPGAPLCRWRSSDDLVLDVMPLSGEILGFSNPWYPAVERDAVSLQVEPGLHIRIASAPTFIATKWAAFDNRGYDDYLASHDVEDIVSVTAGRAELLPEVSAADAEVRSWLRQRTRRFLAHRDADDAIAGALPDARFDPGLIERVRRRFAELAGVVS